MENWINFNELPKRKDGKISWKECNNNCVYFSYNNYNGMFYIIKRISRKLLLINFEGKEYYINPDSLLKCDLMSFVRYAKIFCDNEETVIDNIHVNNILIDTEYSYNINDVISYNGSDLLVLEKIKLMNDRFIGYICRINNMDNSFVITNYALRNGFIDIFTRKNGITIGVDDLWTTRPDIASMLYNPEEGFLYKKKSNKKAVFRCPRCNNVVGEKNISSVTVSSHVSCPYCGDGISYPNKFMYNLLNALGIDFIPECKFDWCIFPSYMNNEKPTKGRYDFVINNLNLIIEMDGGLGHGKKIYSGSKVSIEETIYNDTQKNILARDHGYSIIRIDCDYKNDNGKFEYCRYSVIKALSSYFDLSDVDWADIDKKCQCSDFIKVINLYKKGFSPNEISNMVKREYSTILKYLHKGDKLGMCKYFAYV